MERHAAGLEGSSAPGGKGVNSQLREGKGGQLSTLDATSLLSMVRTPHGRL